MRCQNPPFALLYRLVGILRLFEDGDPIVKHDDGEDRDLFNFSEPEKAALISRRCLSISWRTYLLPMHTLAPAEKGMNASLL